MGGGLNGIGLLIYYATGGTNGGIPLGVTFLVLNAVLVGVASLLISLKFGAKTIYAIGFISVAMAVMQQAVPDNVLADWPTTNCCRPFWAARWREPASASASLRAAAPAEPTSSR